MNANQGKRILITGATGLVGRRASQRLQTRGWELVIVGRSPEQEFRQRFLLPCEYHAWPHPETDPPPTSALNVHAVLNLMGEPIAGHRWSKSVKEQIRHSRVDSTRALAEGLQNHNRQLSTFVSASAIGYYGDRKDEVLTEAATAGDDFLAVLCRDWEAAAQVAPGRHVQVRIGIVLSSQGGALAKMMPIFRRGFGGRIASGQQWMSWIHIDDLVDLLVEAVENNKLQGAINAVTPHPVSNAEFTKILAQTLGVRAPFPVPKFALRLGLGELAEALVASQRVLPEAPRRAGFQFKYERLNLALGNLFARTRSPS